MTAHLAVLERVLSRTALRMRVQRGLDWGVRAGALSCLAWLIAHALRSVFVEPWFELATVLGVALVGLALGALRQLRRARVAEQIDQACELSGRVRAAVAILSEPVAQRSAFAEAALRDAESHSAQASPRKVAPLARPPSSFILLASACSLLGTLALERLPAQRDRELRAQTAPSPAARSLLDRDELLGLRAEVEREHAPDSGMPALRGPMAEFEALLQRIEAADSAPSELIASALALEQKLDSPTAAAPQDAHELRSLSEALQRVAPALARALQDDLAEAAQQLRALSERVHEGALSAQARQQLAEALAVARERERARLADQAREAELSSLLKRKEEAGQGGEPSLLKKRREQKRELEALQRARAEAPARALQELSHELARAGSELAQQAPERASDALQQGSDALDRYREQQASAQQQRELFQAVAQLRELLQRRSAQAEQTEQKRAEGAGSNEQPADHAASSEARRRRFSERAHGRAGAAEGANAGERALQGRAGEPGAGASAGSATIALPVKSPVLVESTELTGAPGGSEHDSTRAPSTPMRAQPDYQDVGLHGVQGSGPTRSQVIRSAAGHGFADARYRKVYGDYRQHAESLLEHDRVPAGYRFHVRRYFELVRPREGQE
ncbi:MAG: hypothetical protein JWN48_2685 [Myxococcaceae bacterium]|nr:hypothetical protein [Myxococcaceae bacterium]